MIWCRPCLLLLCSIAWASVCQPSLIFYPYELFRLYTENSELDFLIFSVMISGFDHITWSHFLLDSSDFTPISSNVSFLRSWCDNWFHFPGFYWWRWWSQSFHPAPSNWSELRHPGRCHGNASVGLLLLRIPSLRRTESQITVSICLELALEKRKPKSNGNGANEMKSGRRWDNTKKKKTTSVVRATFRYLHFFFVDFGSFLFFSFLSFLFSSRVPTSFFPRTWEDLGKKEAILKILRPEFPFQPDRNPVEFRWNHFQSDQTSSRPVKSHDNPRKRSHTS